MIRRTSGSSIVRHVRACGANGAVPLTMARAIELSVRTWRPGRSGVRSRISSCARLLNATRLSAPLGTFHCRRRCRARSVSTRVLPDPAGAMMRAAPPGWVTAASWSGARSASDRLGPGRGERPLLDRHHVHHGDTVDRLGVAERPGVDPHGRAVGRHDVSRRAGGNRGRTGGDREVEPDPGRAFGVAHVDRVRPDEVVEFVELEAEPRAEIERRLARRHRRQLLEVGLEFDDESLAVDRRAPETGARLGRRGECRRGDPDALGREPRRRNRSVRQHERVAGEGVGPGLRRGDAARERRRRDDLAARPAGSDGSAHSGIRPSGNHLARTPRRRSPHRPVRRPRPGARRRSNTAGSARASRVHPRSTHTRSPSL